MANTAARRLAKADLKARLCDISWIARNKFWLAVAPIIYAVERNGKDSIGVLRRHAAQEICKATTART